MSADPDHEVIDSPEALFRHLYEAHGVQEARELDSETAPLHFWLRRHAELEGFPLDQEPRRGAPVDREGSGELETGAPVNQGQGSGEPGTGTPVNRAGAPITQSDRPGGPDRAAAPPRRAAGFSDPLVEAVARALIGRGNDERRVRGAIRAFPGGEGGVRAALVEPMLRAAGERLLGTGRPAPAEPAPAEPAPVPPWEASLAAPPRPRQRQAAADDLWALADAIQRRRRAAQRA
jgi:hypothetical protein